MASVCPGIVKIGELLLIGLLASCSGSNPPSTIASPPESFTELKQKIALIRELPFKREVALANASPNPTAASADRPSIEEYAEPSLSHLSRVYKRLGLLPESTDFARALADY